MSALIRIPVFPLPDVVLFPHTLLPLHIFEPRYREMVRDCLARDRRLVMALLQPGWENDYYGRPPIHAIGGAGEIVQEEELPDGRFNILVRGTMRVAIMAEVPPERSYRIAKARPLPDRYPVDGLDSLAARVDRLKVLYLRIVAEISKPDADPGRVFGGVKDPGVLVDRIAGAGIGDTDVRQRVLEAVDVPARIDLVQERLLTVLAHLSDRNAPTERARGRQH
jgi:Lon protease-like protein